jgi:hypothetical protein
MTSHDISCATGGSLTAAPAGPTVAERIAGQPTVAAPARPAWRVKTAAPGWFTFRSHPSGHVLADADDDDTLVILTAIAQGTRHHWRIIPSPERRDVVIIRRVTGLALTAAPPHECQPARVGHTTYNGAVSKHWSFTDN